jgi:hypothetical protein
MERRPERLIPPNIEQALILDRYLENVRKVVPQICYFELDFMYLY